MVENIFNTIIYQAPNGAIELKGDFDKESIWANQAQIAKLFCVDQSVVSRHINNIFKDNEADNKSNMQKMHIANSDKPVNFYSLDVILAVGYRTNSKVAINFRKWSAGIIRNFITKGYVLNPHQLQKNYDLFQEALENIKTIINNKNISYDEILELIKFFSQTWFSLDAFDKNIFMYPFEASPKNLKIEAHKLYEDILKLKLELIQKEEATELFAKERQTHSLESIIGNIFQSVFEEDVYPSIESKATHLLYFIVKNHPFIDGNKRSGAFAFIWFLQKMGYKFRHKITPEALTAITLLIAISNPKDKQKMIDLVIILLTGK